MVEEEWVFAWVIFRVKTLLLIFAAAHFIFLATGAFSSVG